MRRTTTAAAAVWLWVGLAGPARAGDAGAPALGARPVLPPRPVPVAPACAERSSWCGLDARRGPLEVRDLYVFAQPRLTLPSVGPDTLGCGVTEVRAAVHLSSTFGIALDRTFGPGPPNRRYLIDGETRTAEVSAARGVRQGLDLGVRVPVHWRGGGFLDALIDDFHDLTDTITMDNDRPLFPQDRFRVDGWTSEGPFDWGDDRGVGLGDVEVSAKWRFLDGGRDGWSAAAVLRASVPTGTEPFDGNGFGVGGQLVAARRLGRRFDLFAGVGATAQSEDRVRGVGYEPVRGHAFAALEWRPLRAWSVVVSVDGATRLVDDVLDFAGEHVYAHVDVKVDLSSRTRLEVGFTENLLDQQTTADVGLHAGLVVRL